MHEVVSDEFRRLVGKGGWVVAKGSALQWIPIDILHSRSHTQPRLPPFDTAPSGGKATAMQTGTSARSSLTPQYTIDCYLSFLMHIMLGRDLVRIIFNLVSSR